jgi:hypothetical protein
MREQYTTPGSDLEKEIKAQWAATPAEGSSVATAKEPNAPFRAQVTWDLFAQLPGSDREEYSARAKAEAATARAAYNKALNETPGKSPADRQS